MPNLKHCLIIPCSDKKLSHTGPAYKLYQGVLMGIVNTFDLDTVFKKFKIFFLSAKFGLIEAHDIIEPYNERMPSTSTGQQEFALFHQKSARAILNRYANSQVKLFTVLSKDYQSAFDSMNLSVLNKFMMVYQSRNARGIGDHRSRLKKIISSTLSNPSKPTLFRSGCANLSEFTGFRCAGEAIGTSLAYIDSKGVLSNVIDAIKSKTPLFLDNGLITAITKGVSLSDKDVFKCYIALVKSIRGSQSLSIVVPDNPFCQDSALTTIKTFKKEIKWLATQCNVIIPFHKPVQRSVKEQAVLVTGVLGATNFTVGIPCRNAKGSEWRLSLTDIESLFILKRKDGSPLLKRAHFLALSEKTIGKTYAERLSLCAMYNVDFQADACRTTALFGADNSSRKGSVIAREVEKDFIKVNTINSTLFKEYDSEKEIDSANLWDEINTLSPQQKANLWNECYPFCKIEEANDDDLNEVFNNLTDVYFHDFTNQVKHVLYTVFSMPEHTPSAFEKRTEAIIRCFMSDDNESRLPVQQVIGF